MQKPDELKRCGGPKEKGVASEESTDGSIEFEVNESDANEVNFPEHYAIGGE